MGRSARASSRSAAAAPASSVSPPRSGGAGTSPAASTVSRNPRRRSSAPAAVPAVDVHEPAVPEVEQVPRGERLARDVVGEHGVDPSGRRGAGEETVGTDAARSARASSGSSLPISSTASQRRASRSATASASSRPGVVPLSVSSWSCAAAAR